MNNSRPLHVALIGAGPAGIYAADILSKSGLDVSIDLFERLPAPFGLVRYGVAPDHPRIKQIILALHKVLQRGDVRLIGNVEVGRDTTIDQLREHYDAVIFSTGADRDAPLDLPGSDLPGVFGGADFVSWYDGHPDVPRTWPLEAEQVAVLGVGNVALDVARILAKHPRDLLPTEIPENVLRGLEASPVSEVHVFGRRGPAQAKFTPLELRELGQVPDVDVVVYDEDFQFDEGSEDAMRSSNQTKQVVKTLVDWTLKEPEDLTGSRRIHLHFLHRPVEILGDGRVEALRTERTELTGDGGVRGTGEFVETPVQAVYRAVGYFSSPVPGVPFDEVRGVIPNLEGRVIDPEGASIPGLYATGWVKRGPVGLIGSTKSDARQTIGHVVADAEAGELVSGAVRAGRAETAGGDALLAELDAAGVRYTTWQGWELLDTFERDLGGAWEGEPVRERIKVVDRETMTAISRGEQHEGRLY
ncbi:FAD-dependent oxidoreductase [Bogoriella caseilytica]|uniref:ferredoxin--NADP(+) reductase n=1 Tax=Bogoriella caseilytica TaxID=56055 RepID=A0A3N2BAK1_9MICO|nr:FAD-dependent oxidoreductase [Bogoriella caseilytica]ROR72301.1 ferredoxin--NADP+ reductase [Bogoriella caseilytica]